MGSPFLPFLHPGDILLSIWKAEPARTNRLLAPPKGVSLGGSKLGLRCRSPDIVDLEESIKYKGKRQLRQDENPGGNVGLAEFRERCRINGTVGGHFMGKNPGDVTEANTVRHKS